eukprot:366278-Chlamydomonas_euryale.AAC.11
MMHAHSRSHSEGLRPPPMKHTSWGSAAGAGAGVLLAPPAAAAATADGPAAPDAAAAGAAAATPSQAGARRSAVAGAANGAGVAMPPTSKSSGSRGFARAATVFPTKAPFPAMAAAAPWCDSDDVGAAGALGTGCLGNSHTFSSWDSASRTPRSASVMVSPVGPLSGRLPAAGFSTRSDRS